MKKTIFFFFLVSVLIVSFSSCKKEAINGGPQTSALIDSKIVVSGDSVSGVFIINSSHGYTGDSVQYNISFSDTANGVSLYIQLMDSTGFPSKTSYLYSDGSLISADFSVSSPYYFIYELSSASLTITKSGDNYEIKGTLTFIDGTEVKIDYSGNLPFSMYKAYRREYN